VDGRTVVVGGGCSGTFAVRSLVRAGARRVILIESGEPGPGLAYGPRAVAPAQLAGRVDQRGRG
jgi:glycine/D-amino acid oxidase-like deaminating enzyme